MQHRCAFIPEYMPHSEESWLHTLRTRMHCGVSIPVASGVIVPRSNKILKLKNGSLLPGATPELRWNP